jgi:mannose-1-phosphate guanylyltransferase
VWVVTSEAQVDLVRESLPDLPEENILAEPVGRNTAACCAWAALEVQQRDPDAMLAVLPADHVIESAASFRASCETAIQAALQPGTLVTLGIQPTFPATGYGYIECGEPSGELRQVKRFVEKPDATRARQFLDSGNFLWNAGIFVWSADSILAAFREHAADILQPLESGEARDVYAGLPARPVDIAILEKADRVQVLPIQYGWNDVGSWSALAEVLPADADGQVVGGDARLVTVDSKNCIAYGEDSETIALIGVEDLIVVRSGNATLVCPRDRAQDVRRIVEQLEKDAPERL